MIIISTVYGWFQERTNCAIPLFIIVPLCSTVLKKGIETCQIRQIGWLRLKVITRIERFWSGSSSSWSWCYRCSRRARDNFWVANHSPDIKMFQEMFSLYCPLWVLPTVPDYAASVWVGTGTKTLVRVRNHQGIRTVLSWRVCYPDRT
jgi:hypothetical protein